ncbi:MAG: VanW family protein [Bacteroidota bacterium]
MNLRSFIPAPWRRTLKIALRSLKDRKTGYHHKMADISNRQTGTYDHRIRLEQPVVKSAYFENKVHNIQLGFSQINGLTLKPGEIFSFWHLIKQPTERNNYRLGRNIVANRLSADYGGGLCQLSSIIYHISLISGLHIIERHNHSVDIYKEHERFTPLGADATVVYGHKDLRVQNLFSFPVCFSFTLADDTLTCNVSSPERIAQKQVIFSREYHLGHVNVYTSIGEEPDLVLFGKASYGLPLNNE